MNTPTATAARCPADCRGFTLVELLIAILVGLFLLGGVMTIVQDTRRATSSQTQSTQLQDSVRLAMTTLTDVIQTAGYYSDPLDYGPADAQTLAAVAPFAAGQALSGTGAFGAAAPGDAVSVRYQTANGDGILNCGGTSNTTGANEIFVNTFSLDAQGDLQCTLTSALGTSTIVLIPAITTGVNQLKLTNMQILYGVQTNLGADNLSADSYLDANQVAAKIMSNGKSAWNYVVSVRITLSFSNPIAGLPALQFTRVIGVMNELGVCIQMTCSPP
jgi:type IV pilus assembly protein PilW